MANLMETRGVGQSPDAIKSSFHVISEVVLGEDMTARPGITDEAKQNDDEKRYGEGAVLGTIAYSAYWGFLVSCLIFPVATQSAIGAKLTILPALCGLVSFSACQLIVTKSGHLAGGKRSLGPIVLGMALTWELLCAMALSAFSIQASLITQAVAWFLWGIGQAATFPLLGIMQQRSCVPGSDPRPMTMRVAGGLAAASLLCALALFAPDPFRSFLPALYYAIAIGCILVGRSKGYIRHLAASEGLSDDFKPLKSLKILSPMVIGSASSLLVCYCIARFGMQATLAVVTIGLLAGGLGMMALAGISRANLVNQAIERLFFPITALCFFAISFLPDLWKLVPACICAFVFFVYVAFHWSYNIALARRFDIHTPIHYATCLLSPATGMAIGWAIAALFALLGGNLAEPFVLFFGWIVAYIIVLSIAPYASDPLFETDLLDPDMKNSPEDRGGNSWEQACAIIAEGCRLSPREREIFGMLAHGRNVSYISETLFISENTAKTHKYRIYRKLGVNTHQELLDCVESAERELLNAQ